MRRFIYRSSPPLNQIDHPLPLTTTRDLFHDPLTHENVRGPWEAHDPGHHLAAEADSLHEEKASDADFHFQVDDGALEGVLEMHHGQCRHYWRT
jgi:hypothetical protein